MTEDKLPAQLSWRDFVCVLKYLGYSQYQSKPGAARVFRNEHRDPEFVTFHEPHGKDPLRRGTLREYVNKLKLSRDQFLEVLMKC